MTKPEDPALPQDPALNRAQAERLLKAWEAPKGRRYWSAVNNSEVGLWYTATAFVFLLFGGVLALLIRTQLAVPENDFLSADLYNQVFTLHGTVMMFLFAVPCLQGRSASKSYCSIKNRCGFRAMAIAAMQGV